MDKNNKSTSEIDRTKIKNAVKSSKPRKNIRMVGELFRVCELRIPEQFKLKTKVPTNRH